MQDVLRELALRRRMVLSALFSSGRMRQIDANLFFGEEQNPWTAVAFLDVTTAELFPQITEVVAAIGASSSELLETDRREFVRWAAVVASNQHAVVVAAGPGRLGLLGAAGTLATPAGRWLVDQLRTHWVERLLVLQGEVPAASVALQRLRMVLQAVIATWSEWVHQNDEEGLAFYEGLLQHIETHDEK